ncbi:MAG: M42 family metallopeptidase [Armatimonadetes bacterium]|nr:M42 family metallopeptidase [Armatimonadota bacterium]
MNFELLKELSEATGVPGNEDNIRKIVARELKGIGELSVDLMGNVICRVKGKGKNPKKLMIAAHMDEIGFMVKYIDDKGFARVNPLGGWDPRMMAAQRVKVHTESGPVPGLLMPGTKPKHMLSPAEIGKAADVNDYFIDMGMDGETAKKKVQLGDSVTMDRDCQRMGNLITGKAMDDRACVFIMIEAMKAMKSNDVEVIGVATVQEEIGLRGATSFASGEAVDMVVALDVTLSNEIPGIPAEFQVTQMGKGAAIKIMDSSLICHPKMVDHFKKVAKKNKIAHQMEVLPAGGTDAGGVQKQHGGIPAFTLSTPCRYIHTVNETVHQDDVQACIDLLARYIEDAHKGDYTYSL